MRAVTMDAEALATFVATEPKATVEASELPDLAGPRRVLGWEQSPETRKERASESRIVVNETIVVAVRGRVVATGRPAARAFGSLHDRMRDRVVDRRVDEETWQRHRRGQCRKLDVDAPRASRPRSFCS